MLELNCTNEEKVRVQLAPRTTTGKPAKLDGPVTVEVQSGNGSVQMIDDLSFYAVSGDDPGDTTFVVSGDADLGSGVVAVQDVVLLHVAGSMAANLGLTADAPVTK